MEGIPYCCKNIPLLYEVAREYLAYHLDVDSNEIGMIGSARLGFSLAPDKPLANFQPGISDVDLFVVSEKLWLSLVSEYNEGVQLWQANPECAAW